MLKLDSCARDLQPSPCFPDSSQQKVVCPRYRARAQAAADKADAPTGSDEAKPAEEKAAEDAELGGDADYFDAEAKALATSIMEKSAQGRVKGTATVQGNGALHAGKKVKFTGLGDGQNPEAIIVSATHIIEPKVGFRTKLRFKSEGAPE